MKRLPNYWALCQIFLLISFLLVSTNLISSPYSPIHGHDHHEHFHATDLDQNGLDGRQFNRFQDQDDAINIARGDLRILPILLIPSDLENFVKGSDFHGQENLTAAVLDYEKSMRTQYVIFETALVFFILAT